MQSDQEKGKMLTHQGMLLSLWMLLSILCLSYQSPVEDRLHKKLLHNYNTESRPVFNEWDTMNVTFGIELSKIIELDEKNEMLHTNLWLSYMWNDYRLKWNISEFDGMTSTTMSFSRLYIPDIHMYNSAQEDAGSKRDSKVNIYSSGN